jgi:thiol:disulfide interchange protein
MPEFRFSSFRRGPLALLWLLLALCACSPSPAQQGGFRDILGSKPGGSPNNGPPADITMELIPVEGADEAIFRITTKIPDGRYIYDMGEEQPFTIVDVKASVGLEPIDEFQPDHPPKVVDDPNLNKVVRKFFKKVVWMQRQRLTPGTARSDVRITGRLVYQVCDDNNCRNARLPFDVQLADAKPDSRADEDEEADDLPAPAEPPRVDRGPAPAREPAPGEDGDRNAPGIAGDPARNAPPADAAPAVVPERGIDRSQGILWFMLTAAGFGFAALLTPCSFPMVPITVSFFQKQSEKAHHKPVTMALVYCAGIVGMFTVLGLVLSAAFGGAFLNQLSNNPWLNLFLALLLVFFALNLLGMFEIRIPSWLLTYTATQEGRGGMVGVLFMALTFTLTSFTCTFAFVGTVLVAAANGDWLWPAMGLFAFSAAFSLPFFFLALFPSLLQKLPRSGGWMNIVKVVMGLIELGAAFKFFSVADLRWHPVAWVFDYELVMSAWMIISISGALYLLGLFRLPHDMPTDHIGVARFIGAMSFLGLAAYLGVGLYSSEKPTGKVWENIAAFAPPRFKGGNEQFGPALDHGGIKYALDFQRAVEYAAKVNKPLFIDFTGVNCVNCRKMENGPLSQPVVTDRLKNFVCVQVYADKVPHIPDPAEAERLLDFNIELQTRWFGDTTLPSYAVVPADLELAKRKIGESLLSHSIGYNPDEEQFARFLDDGMKRWNALQANRGAGRVVGAR